MYMNNNPSVNDILRYIVNKEGHPVDGSECEYVYIILGRPGPTGKTWMWDQLCRRGFRAVEISENILPFVSYDDFGNHYMVNHASKTVTIVLNKPISRKGEEK